MILRQYLKRGSLAMIRFKFTYQDRALNKHVEIWNAQSWEDAIILAFSLKKAEWKLLMVECIPEGVDYIRPDDKFTLD